MKKFLKAPILAVLAISLLAFAEGAFSDSGDVSISSIGDNIYMAGKMNVRYNEKALGSPYIYAYGYPASSGSKIVFAGRDSSGTTFSCWVSPDHPSYQVAVGIKNNLQNGSFLFVHRESNSNSCYDFTLGNYSSSLD